MTTAEIICNVFLEKSGKKDILLSYLSPSKQQRMEKLGKSKMELPLKKEFPLSRIHPTRLSPILRTFSEKEASLLMFLLTDEQKKSIQKELFFVAGERAPSEFAKPFLEKFLWQKVTGESAPCLFSLLEETPLLQIFDLSFENLDRLIDLLAMNDLALEMKLIIDKVRIKAIEDSLSTEQKEYLQSLMQHKPTISFGKMELANWDMSKQTLQKLLLQRGINRLAKACHFMSSDFLWYLSHFLDQEKSRMFFKLKAAKQDAHICETLCDQIMEIIQYLKRKKVR